MQPVEAAKSDAVLRNLQTLAESTQRLSAPAKERQPQVPWREISAFRNVLVHDYLGVNANRIWNIVMSDVPPLKRAIQDLSGTS